MTCLHCGDCCLRMSPLSQKACPLLIKDENFYFCKSYKTRPMQCKNHSFPCRFCPIGISKLNLTESWHVAQRIDAGYEKINDHSNI